MLIGRMGLCLGMLALGLFSSAAAPPREHPRQKRIEDRTLTTLRALEQTVENVAFEDKPLADAVDWFRAEGVENIIVRWVSIEKRGKITRQTPISLQLSGMGLGELLDYTLELASLNAISSDGELTYMIRNGVVEISTRADFDDETYVRIYDVAAQIHPVMGRDTGASRKPCNRPAPREAGGAPCKTKIGPTTEELLCLRDVKAGRLIQVLKSIRPRTWAENGGLGRVVRFGDKLIITQTVEMHEIIGGAFRERARYRQSTTPRQAPAPAQKPSAPARPEEP